MPSWTGSSWSIQTVDSEESFLDFHVFLALDHDNNPHILYGYTTSNNDITHPQQSNTLRGMTRRGKYKQLFLTSLKTLETWP